MGFFSSIKNFFGKSEKSGSAIPDAKAPEEAEKNIKAEENKNSVNVVDQINTKPDESLELLHESDNNKTNTPLINTAKLTTEKLEAASPPADFAGKEAGQEAEEPKRRSDVPSSPNQIEKGHETQAEADDPFRYFAFPETDKKPNDDWQKTTIIQAGLEETEKRAAQEKEEGQAKFNELLVRLRAAEPRLSAWLNITLDNVDSANDLFWERLTFLLRSLEAPEKEIETFINDFKKWLDQMEYYHLDEFRSELQYRLALALDLEDEEDERNRLLLKLSQSLAKTRENLGRQLDHMFASHGELDEKFWNELEELFIMADMGYETALAMVERLKESARKNKIRESSGLKKLLLAEMKDIFNTGRKIKSVNKPEVILMSGVNGAGKTTTIAKLANRLRMQGKKVLVVAADTFRAAAIEQLQVWAERAGALFYAKAPGSDPASVAWEGLDMALRENVDVVFIDTAGRLQTRTNLMEELGKIRQVLGKKHPGSPHRSILVLDATTGQNALSQAKLFREAAGVDELILTKIDGTAKGGVALAVALQEKLPISFVGLGEKMEDLRPFNGEDFAEALLG